MIELGPEIGAYSAVGVALLLLFRMVFRTLAIKDTEVERHMRRLTRERNRSNVMAQYHAARADHWYARALGDPNPPPLPPAPTFHDDDTEPAHVPPPN